ncbi:MAG: ShlB/FhaC/HecB family hemolysin secretion/activation protein [Inhella sp.]
MAFIAQAISRRRRGAVAGGGGQLSAVEVRGVPAVQHEAVRAPARAADRHARKVRRLDAQIQLANENPAHQTQVSPQPGVQPGQVEAVLTVQQQPPSRWHARLDNSGGERTGRWRAARAGLAARQLRRRRPRAQHRVPNRARGALGRQGLRAGLRQPFASLLALDTYGAWSDVDSGTSRTAAGDLAFSGRGRVMGLRLSRYLERAGNVDQRLQVALEQRHLPERLFDRRHTGACGAAGASVRLQPLSLGYTAQAVGTSAGVCTPACKAIWPWAVTATQAAFEAIRPDMKRRYGLLRFGGDLGLPLDDWGSLEHGRTVSSAPTPWCPPRPSAADSACAATRNAS